MKNISIRWKILIPFLLLILVTGGLLSYFSYQYQVKLTLEHFTQNISDTMKRTNETFDIVFKNVEDTVSMLSESHDLYTYKDNSLVILNKFREIQMSNEAFQSVYYGTIDGEIYNYPLTKVSKGYRPKEQIWYKQALENIGHLTWTEPYLHELSKKEVISAAKTVSTMNQFQGVIGIDFKLEKLEEMIQRISFGRTGYAFLVDHNGTILAHPSIERIGQNIREDGLFKELQLRDEQERPFIFSHNDVEKLVSSIYSPKTGWYLIGTIEMEEFRDKAQEGVYPLLLTLAILMLVATGISFYVVAKIVQPIRLLSQSMTEVEAGNLVIDPTLNNRDEVGRLAYRFSLMTARVRDVITEVSHSIHQVATAANKLSVHAENNTKSSQEITHTVEKIAAAAITEANYIDETTKATTEVSRRMDRIGQYSHQLNERSNTMLTVSQAGMHHVDILRQQFLQTEAMTNKMVQTIGELDQHSQDIVQVISSITIIAKQIKLLSLNAGIEATRAGEFGKGFVVVANEIRNLSMQTETALGEITRLILQSQQLTQNTVQLIRETHTVNQEQGTAVLNTEASFHSLEKQIIENDELIHQVAGEIEQLVEYKEFIEQTMADITAMTHKVSSRTSRINASMQEQSASVEELYLLAGQMESNAQQLLNRIDYFKVE